MIPKAILKIEKMKIFTWQDGCEDIFQKSEVNLKLVN